MEALIDQLVQQGVQDFCIGSGSRSTPLVLAAANHPQARIHKHLDERALAFFALGCAQGKSKPTAIIATSGTAIGNLLPAVMEAHHSSTPIIILSADRPGELRDTCANQATDQIKIFQNFTRWQFELDPHMPDKSIRSIAAQAVFRTTADLGPVHINCPLREPLYRDIHIEFGKPIELHIAPKQLSQEYPLPSRGVIAIGKLAKKQELAPILDLAERLQWPVFADILSNARLMASREQIRHFHWVLPNAPNPQCIVHFGDRLLSKRFLEWAPQVPYIHVNGQRHWYDPAARITDRIYTDVLPHFTAPLDPSWLPIWLELDRSASLKINQTMELRSFTESQIFHHLSSLSWDKKAFFLGTSMPVREADWFFFPKTGCAFFSNRGLSGIDGNLATAAGLAEGLQSPLVAFVGDLTALHDLNSLQLIERSRFPITLVISNNGGGGIFSHLAVKNAPRFQELFAFEHSIEFQNAAAMFKLPYFRMTHLQWPKCDSSCIIEITNSRPENAAFHQKLTS